MRLQVSTQRAVLGMYRVLRHQLQLVLRVMKQQHSIQQVVLGVMAPVLALIIKPVVEEYVPVVVPVRVTDCALVRVLQNGDPVYEIVAAGRAVTVTVRIPVAFAQPGPPVTV